MDMPSDPSDLARLAARFQPARAEILAGNPARLGAHWDGRGVNVAVFSEHAEVLELCLFDGDGREVRRLALPERDGPVHHGYVPGMAPGAAYGLRAHGAWNPHHGHRFNPAKLLLDPYARALHGAFLADEAVFGIAAAGGPDADLTPDPRDSAPFVPKCLVTGPDFPEAAPRPDRAPRVPWDRTLIYEAHVKGLTRQWEAIDPPLRGTYEGLGEPATLEHLTKLGVTAVELLPVQALVDEPFLRQRGLTNYWGYNPIGFFALEPRYLGPGGVAGFRETVRRLHAAGIEVILDVVYNHTAEGDHLGPTYSFRGLDNAAYYLLQPRRQRFYVDDTGCGNTLNLAHPFVQRLVLDSLRYWVEVMGIDGFRFDLATTLAREPGGFDPGGGFLDALRQDPVLAGAKLIAEPWDIGPGGYRLGGFPPPFAEWNDRFRDDVRRFWRGDPHAAPDLAARLLGSAEIFDRAGRRPWSSLNLLTAHDGFTLADLVSYAQRHNEANGEGNRDGHHANWSDNCGVEGPSDDPQVVERRARRRRNLLATVFLSQGTPMLLAGDEIGNSQGGNNNAYCQDNPIAWIDWAGAEADLLEFVRFLSAFRRRHPVLRQTLYLHGQHRSDGAADVVWRALDAPPEADGAPNWRDPALRALAVRLRCAAEAPAYAQHEDELVLAFNGGGQEARLRLPAPPDGRLWHRLLDTARPDLRGEPAASGEQPIAAESLAAFGLSEPT